MARFRCRLGAAALLSLLSVALFVVPAIAGPADGTIAASISLRVVPDSPDGTGRYDTMMRYFFTVTNTGDVVLTDIVLVDTLCGEVGRASLLEPGSVLELEGWARVESGDGIATVTAIAFGDVEVSATATHSIEPYIAHDWPEDPPASPQGEMSQPAVTPPSAAIRVATEVEPHLPFTGSLPVRHLTLAGGFAVVGLSLRRLGRSA